MTGYVYCAHKHCFAIIVGEPGDVCDDCQGEHYHLSGWCDGCDNDS